MRKKKHVQTFLKQYSIKTRWYKTLSYVICKYYTFYIGELSNLQFWYLPGVSKPMAHGYWGVAQLYFPQDTVFAVYSLPNISSFGPCDCPYWNRDRAKGQTSPCLKFPSVHSEACKITPKQGNFEVRDVLVRGIMVIISQCIYIYQIIMFYYALMHNLVFPCIYSLNKVKIRLHISFSSNIYHFFKVTTFKILCSRFLKYVTVNLFFFVR
jgi:hypothetical protein